MGYLSDTGSLRFGFKLNSWNGDFTGLISVELGRQRIHGDRPGVLDSSTKLR